MHFYSTTPLLVPYSVRTLQVIHVRASTHLLSYSLAFVMPSPPCAASRRVLLRLYCNLRIKSPHDALLHLELRIYTVFAEFALLELGVPVEALLATTWQTLN